MFDSKLMKEAKYARSNMKSKAIIIGPWIGEFSYEMCWWAPKIRKLCRENYQDYHKVHVGYAGRDIFYKDFIDETFFYPQKVVDAIGEAIGADASEPPTTGKPTLGSIDAQAYLDTVVSELQARGYQTEILPATDMVTYESTFEPYPYGDYINMQPSPALVEQARKAIGSDFLFILSRHRNREINHNDNWRKDRWATYFKRVKQKTGFKLVSIKHPQVFTTDDVETVECNSVEEQMAYMKASRFCIAGSTGAAALFYFLDKEALIFFDPREAARKRIHMKWQVDLLSDPDKVKVYIPSPSINDMKVNDAVKATVAFASKDRRKTLPEFDPDAPLPIKTL